jgi:hypothetical protein
MSLCKENPISDRSAIPSVRREAAFGQSFVCRVGQRTDGIEPLGICFCPEDGHCKGPSIYFCFVILSKPIIAEGAMVWSLLSDYGNNIVAFSSRGHFPRRCQADSAGLTMEETIEFEALDALPPFDDSGNIAWSFEGGPMTSREKRWLELYLKKGS